MRMRIAIAGVAVAMLAGCSGGSSSAIDLSRQVCGLQLATDDGFVIVDGRCHPQPALPVGIYAEPRQSSQALARAETGAVLKAKCYELGESIVDATSQGSDHWIEIDLGAALGSASGKVKVVDGINLGGGDFAYIPDTWVDGDGGLPACTG